MSKKTLLKASTFNQFIQLCKNDIKFKNCFHKLGNPRPFDVTLRDGIQTLKSEHELAKFSLDYKKKLYHEIVSNHFPANIEIGSLVSKKVLPILADSMDLFQYVEKYNNEITKITTPKHFMLIPNMEKLCYGLNNNIYNFSFITSVSNSFQQKNTKKNLQDTKKELLNMVELIHKKKHDRDDNYDIYHNDIDYDDNKYNVKLYISCISECPLEGKIDNDVIVHEILRYNAMNIDNICLSDTCGTLEVEDFEYIVDTCQYFGLCFSKFSLHLHVKQDRINIVKEIIHKALDRKIINFDVSLLETGGCSVTMDETKLKPNLSYDLYYETLVEYIEKRK
jgi:isopropylmalate/homocitrate/citramalate synthase